MTNFSDFQSCLSDKLSSAQKISHQLQFEVRNVASPLVIFCAMDRNEELCSPRRGLCYIAISILLLISGFSNQKILSDGRIIPSSEMATGSSSVAGEKLITRAQIGSRPPKCETRCSRCQHCVAIQVPTNPQINACIKSRNPTSTTSSYYGGDEGSNYKPMSWKCKCGNLIFNP